MADDQVREVTEAICKAAGNRYPSDTTLNRVAEQVRLLYGCGLADGNAEGWKQARVFAAELMKVV